MPPIESTLTAAEESTLTAAEEAVLLAFPAATIGFFDVLRRPNAAGSVVPSVPGLEFTLPDNRMHFDFPENLTHFTLPDNRMHFDIPEED